MSSKPLLIGLAFSSQAVLIFKLFSNPRFHGKNPEFERFHLVLPLVWIPRHVSLLLVLGHQPKKKKKSVHGLDCRSLFAFSQAHQHSHLMTTLHTATVSSSGNRGFLFLNPGSIVILNSILTVHTHSPPPLSFWLFLSVFFFLISPACFTHLRYYTISI